MTLRFTQYFAKRSKTTPQSLPIPGSIQIANSAGGYSFPVDDWTRVRRFLILGSEGGTYYISEQKLTIDNADALCRLIGQDGSGVVRLIVEISDAGRAPKNDPAIFALALCAGMGDEATRRAALTALPRVCRIGTHLFRFAEFVESFRGWGRALRRATGEWYNHLSPERLQLQLAKYQQREGWSHRDLLRLSHPKPLDTAHDLAYRWAAKKDFRLEGPNAEALPFLAAVDRLRFMADEKELVAEIERHRLPMEVVPADKRSPAVYRAMLKNFGMTALLRNLGNLSKHHVLTQAEPEAVKLVVERLTNKEAIRESRLHPIAILIALLTYKSGKGRKGGGQWTPVPRVIDALDEAFYLSFGNVEPTGKRLLLALDVSSSMDWGVCAGAEGLTPRDGSVAMAMAALRTEKDALVMGFADGLRDLKLSARQRLDDAIRTAKEIPFGGTDCSLPITWALANKAPVDAFVVYTDSETWAGNIHPVQALRDYRDRMGIPAKLVVVGMASNGFSIADPADAGMMDVAGFDASAPEIISQFIRGEI
jgi:60 kDa SS-A/Ro ribonucleoprotein